MGSFLGVHNGSLVRNGLFYLTHEWLFLLVFIIWYVESNVEYTSVSCAVATTKINVKHFIFIFKDQK